MTYVQIICVQAASVCSTRNEHIRSRLKHSKLSFFPRWKCETSSDRFKLQIHCYFSSAIRHKVNKYKSNDLSTEKNPRCGSSIANFKQSRSKKKTKWNKIDTFSKCKLTASKMMFLVWKMVDQIELTTTINNNGTTEWTSRFEKWSIVWMTRGAYLQLKMLMLLLAMCDAHTQCIVCDSYQSK